tara:strand:- start:19170 stop:19871 length:702 start_codon:yes stop_codon:yes gene_type:complete
MGINQEDRVDGLIKFITDLAEKNNISAYELGKKSSISASSVNKIFSGENKSPKLKTLLTLENDLEKLIVGSKSQYELKEEFSTQINEEGALYPEATEEGVPYYDVEFAAGFEDFTQSQAIQPTSFIKHPFFNGCDYVIRASGQSMGKIIKHGDAIGITKVDSWQDFLPFGEIYAIVTKDNFRMIKVITKGKTENTFTLISKPTDNKKEDFPPQQIKKSHILSIFKVQASSYLF